MDTITRTDVAQDFSPATRVFTALKSWVACVVSLTILGSAGAVHAQNRNPPPGAGPAGSPAEIQRLFDAYVVMQAQRELELTDGQYPRFIEALRRLQMVRRRAQMERLRTLQELRRLSRPNAPPGNDGAITDRLKALDDLDRRSADEIRQAFSAVDTILDARQRARFRLLEEQIERWKIDLLARARRGLNRPQPPPEP